RRAQVALQGRSVPLSGRRSCLIGSFQKLEQYTLRVGGRTDRVVGQNEFSESCFPASARRERSTSEPFRLRIGIGVERSSRKRRTARPESGAADFMGISLTRYRIRQPRYAAGMQRGPSPGKARDCEVKAAPKEMHRAHFAEKATPEDLQDTIDL